MKPVITSDYVDWRKESTMIGQKGVWLILTLLLSATVFAGEYPVKLQGGSYVSAKKSPKEMIIQELFSRDNVLKTNMFSTVEFAKSTKAIQIMRIFSLGELNISSPIIPFCHDSANARSQASLNLNLPNQWGGIEVRGGVSYQVQNKEDMNKSSPQEQVLYLVSTKSMTEYKWKPFLSLSYIRSQVRDVSATKKLGRLGLNPKAFSGQARYSNMEAVGTCCGIQPFENLSMILSYNYLKPLFKGDRLTNYNTKAFDDMKNKTQTTGLDLKVDYAVRKGVNILVKSEYLIPNGVLRDTVDAPILIEGQLVVSF